MPKYLWILENKQSCKDCKFLQFIKAKSSDMFQGYACFLLSSSNGFWKIDETLQRPIICIDRFNLMEE
jgi:hypothetical protein